MMTIRLEQLWSFSTVVMFKCCNIMTFHQYYSSTYFCSVFFFHKFHDQKSLTKTITFKYSYTHLAYSNFQQNANIITDTCRNVTPNHENKYSIL